MGLREDLQFKVGIDIGVFAEKKTWSAFVISIVLFSLIGYGALSIFGTTSQMFGVSSDVQPVPDFEVQTLNRSTFDVADENGIFKLSDHRGEIVIIDFMAVDCSNCHYVQEHIELQQEYWESMDGPYKVTIISIGAWYSYESLDDLNRTFGDNDSSRQMPWTVATGAPDSVILNATSGERGDIVEQYSAQAIPVAMVIDSGGYLVAKENTGTPLDGWSSFDEAVSLANQGDARDLRMGLAKVDRSMSGVFVLGLFLGVLVYFSPCAFPVLPGYVGYYINLGLREDELREAGKLEGPMPRHTTVGILAGLGMMTFFVVLGGIVFGLSEVVDLSGWLHRLALAIAVLLFVLGSFMLMGGSAKLLSWVDRYVVQKFSTTEMDDMFTPRRNMYLWGIGYAAASIDCTAAAVLPFVAYLTVIGGEAVFAGLGGIMLCVFLLMMSVTIIVGVGSKKIEGFLRRATDMIKMTGSWMMMFAGIGLTIYLTQAELIAGLI